MRHTVHPFRIPIACALAIACAHCGDDPPPPPPLPVAEPPKPAASTPPVALVTASATASASAIPIGTLPAQSGPVKWSDFAGPSVKPELKPKDLAWAVLPVSTGWETLKFTVMPVDRIEDEFAVFRVSIDGKEGATDFFVPGAFVSPAVKAEKLKMDDAVMVSTEGSRSYGRVLEAATEDRVKVRFRFAGTLQETEVPLTHAIKLDDRLAFGAPCAVRREKEERGRRTIVWNAAQFVQTSEDKAWVVSASGKPERVLLRDVKPLVVSSIHKIGDTVWTTRMDEFTPGKIDEVVDGGTRYRVKLEDSSEAVSGMETVTTPIK